MIDEKDKLVLKVNKIDTPLIEGWHDAEVSNVAIRQKITDDTGTYDEVVISYRIGDIEMDQPYRVDTNKFNTTTVLYEHYTALMGEKPVDELLLTKLIGKKCRVHVIHKIDDMGSYEDIDGIMAITIVRNPSARIIDRYTITERRLETDPEVAPADAQVNNK